MLKTFRFFKRKIAQNMLFWSTLFKFAGGDLQTADTISVNSEREVVEVRCPIRVFWNQKSAALQILLDTYKNASLFFDFELFHLTILISNLMMKKIMMHSCSAHCEIYFFYKTIVSFRCVFEAVGLGVKKVNNLCWEGEWPQDNYEFVLLKIRLKLLPFISLVLLQ